MAGYEYDVFVSYRHREPDMAWVQGVLVPRLEADGVRVCLDERSFRLGMPVVVEMEHAVLASRYTLAVLTRAYGTSNFTDLEYLLADRLGTEQAARRLVVALRDPISDLSTPPEVEVVQVWDDAEVESAIRWLGARLTADLDA